jgi:P-type Cu2+ transporter
MTVPQTPTPNRTAVVHVGGLQWATSARGIEHTLSERPGVVDVEANALSQTATVTFDPRRTSIDDLQAWVRECGYHCAGESLPTHVCAPAGQQLSGAPTGIQPTDHDHRERAGRTAAAMSPHDAMGHGGHAGMSMADMVADMRNRFLVAALLSVPITLYSPMGRDLLGFSPPAPFGLRDDVFTLILSLPVVFYAGWIFFDGAVRALRNKTLDMMVLVALAIGAGWLYSLLVTLRGGGRCSTKRRQC